MAITKVSPDLLDLDAGITITTADNSDNIALVSTDADANTGPNISFWRNSGSPADQDKIGDINWYAENDAGEKTHIVNVRAHIQDVSDGSEDARFLLQTIVGGATETSRLELLPTETVINQDSKDLDFRVESDDNANMLFVDGGNDRVGIGTASPSYPLNLYGTETGEGTVKGQLGIQSTTAYGSSPQAGITFTNEHTSGSQAIMGGIRVGKSNTTDTNYSGFMAFDVRNHGAVAFEAMRIDSTGVLTSKSHVVTGIDNTAFEVKTNHGGNPSAFSLDLRNQCLTLIKKTLYC